MGQALEVDHSLSRDSASFVVRKERVRGAPGVLG